MKDVIRVGRISSINPEKGLVRVYYPDKDSTTSELPLFHFHQEFKLPKVNDQVIVLHLSNDTSSGVVLGGFWNDIDQPPKQAEYKKDLESDSYEMLQKGNFIIHSPQISLEGEAGIVTLTEILEMKSRLEALERRLEE
ncbi:phage baseplate assembly protein V [Lacrimispora sp.]|jgi:hypothetical protein|uniref:phage baseplate assembly protein V n=1 Tax=Lacrimispora sp. TaxID=2719234 RepID=UPI0028AA6275|nr:phage baseplate assembly protein V [Lacrimispora sp.]